MTDLDDAEEVIRKHSGFDNDDIGAILARLARVARTVTKRLATIDARLDALEATSAATPAPAPAEPVVEDAPVAPPD